MSKSGVYSDLGSSSNVDSENLRLENKAKNASLVFESWANVVQSNSRPLVSKEASLHVVQYSCLKAIASLESNRFPRITKLKDSMRRRNIKARAVEDLVSVSSWTDIDTDEEWALNPHQAEFDAWFKFARENSDCTFVPTVGSRFLQNETSMPGMVSEESIQGVMQTSIIQHKRNDLWSLGDHVDQASCTEQR